MACKGNRVGGCVGLALLLLLAEAELGRAQGELGPGEEILSQVAFVQRTRLNTSSSSEFMFEFGDDEIFHVDLQLRETVWRLPEFGEFTSFQAEGAQGNIAVLRSNLDILIKRSNETPATIEPPKLTLYPEKAVELEEPNTLICVADEFSPPVLKMSWFKNGEPVTDKVQTTDYYPKKSNSFRRFSYLTFIPTLQDDYTCQVSHWGLKEPLAKIWNANMPEPLPETTENVVCALGLAVGIAGIVIGTVLMVKSKRMSEARYRGGRL